MAWTGLKTAGFLILVALVTSVQKTSASICSEKFETLTASNGSLKSPNYPSNYPHNTSKVWKITAPQGEKIILQFHTFVLQPHSAQCGAGPCGCDYVKVRNKCSDQTPVQTLCGTIKPLIITSADNEMWVEFRSDDKTNAIGFLALYRALPCKGLKPYSCVVNGNPSCCSSVETAVPCHDSRVLQRSHCRFGQFCCILNNNATCCGSELVKCTDKFSSKRKGCSPDEVCCVANGSPGCCDSNAAAVKCTDRFAEERSHCKKGTVCCVVNKNKPGCCSTGTRLNSWSLMVAMFAVMVLIGITS